MSAQEEGENEWEDEDMEDLFSFGIEEGANPMSNDSPELNVPSPALTAEPGDGSARDRSNSADSFLEMLGDDVGIDVDGLTSNISGGTELLNDQETEDILDWLNADDDDDVELSASSDTANEILEEKNISTEESDANISAQVSLSTQATLETQESSSRSEPSQEQGSELPQEQGSEPASEPAQEQGSEPGPELAPEQGLEPEAESEAIASLEQALISPDSTPEVIRDFYIKEGLNDEALRRELWCRMVSHKTSTELEQSSLADSFVKWQREANIDSFDDKRSVWLKNECIILAERITTTTREEATNDLISLLLFYYIGNESRELDPLLPPVACTILSAGIPVAASSVLFSKIMASAMPLLALTRGEQLKAAKMLHTEFYLLACYHLPLLVFHLDRHSPGWYWPKQLETGEIKQKDAWKNIENQGVIPQSWLISHLAGECNGTFMNPKWLLSLWDLILTSNNNSLRFFLALAVLEKHSDPLLMITGENLVRELNHILEFKEGTTLEGFAIEAEDETTSSEADDWVREWCARARALYEATPPSVIRRLRKIEDEAVSSFLEERQRKTEANLEAKLEAESKAHKQAMEAERERRADESRLRINRARLVAYYKQYNPGKEGNIDKIFETYNGRLDQLDAKLKAKYGQGFNPAMKSTTSSTSKLFETMNQGFSKSRKRFSQALKREEKANLEEVKKHEVTVKVIAKEVLPVICWSKESDSLKRASSRPHDALKYYLVDSRPEQTAQEQGRFPTSLSLSPDALLDPDLMKQQEEIFESLRGAVHIVVMGEGFSALPSLYGQKLNPNLSQLIAEDDSRADLCALFFVKRGFPFVSLLDGGFCGAHAWLSRHGHKRSLQPKSVLIDYDSCDSMFGQLEKAYREQVEFANASAGEKTQLAFQGLFDKSLTSLTLGSSRFENLASGFAGKPTSSDPKGATTVNNNNSNNNVDSGGKAVANSVNENGNGNGQVKARETRENDQSSSNPSVLSDMERLNGASNDVNSSTSRNGVQQKQTADAQQPSESRFGGLGAVFTKTLKSNSTENVSPASGVSSKILKSNSARNIHPPSRVSDSTLGSNSTGNASAVSGHTQETQQTQENRFASIGAAFNKSMKVNTGGEDKLPGNEQQPQKSSFASFGAAFNKSLMMNKSNHGSQQEAPTLLKRNIFSKFGGKDKKPPQASRFGMSSLRNPLAK